MDIQKHTPTPWEYHIADAAPVYHIAIFRPNAEGIEETRIADFYNEAEALNAVKAVNEHAQLAEENARLRAALENAGNGFSLIAYNLTLKGESALAIWAKDGEAQVREALAK